MYLNMNIKSVLNINILYLYGLPYGADYLLSDCSNCINGFLYMSLFDEYRQRHLLS